MSDRVVLIFLQRPVDQPAIRKRETSTTWRDILRDGVNEKGACLFV